MEESKLPPIHVPDVPPSCQTCKQNYGEYEKCLLPHTQQLLGWRVFYETTVCGKLCRIPKSNECQPCWGDRRRNDKGLSQLEVIKKNEDQSEDQAWWERRTKRVKEGHANSEKMRVESKSKEYDDGFDEGFFYRLIDFITMRAGSEKVRELKSVAQQVAFASDDLEAIVIRDKNGDLGVRVSNLPGQAAYKYKVGARDDVARVSTRDFSDADEAKDFAGEEARVLNAQAPLRLRKKKDTSRRAGRRVPIRIGLIPRRGECCPSSFCVARFW